ncbi:2'-5' RNA ligase family protein [Massilia putida]|uniref:2'-5' RNA ligase family protein n=1 Tax=Massilia putida TaxID=1141883 RepID=UPI0012EC3C52|nr:2'-5' RNA ligase family protein [Massilia putida]
MSHSPAPDLRAHYDAMWERAWPAVALGDVDCDTHLGGGLDPRRGMTLIARPDPALAARLEHVQDRLAGADPRQYRQPRADLHVTILSLFTVTEDYAPHLARRAGYTAAVRAAVDGLPAFDIDFDGITISRGAVLARGFPRDGTLELLRTRLRDALRARGLDGMLDQRYRLVTAHSTLLRFIAPPAGPARFAAVLAELRGMPLGTMHVDTPQLVVNDWYMSSAAVESIEAFPLRRHVP